MSETYVITLPITEVQADMAGMPASWLERAVRAVGTPTLGALSYVDWGLNECQCKVPMIKCDDKGCNCEICGKPERVL